MIDNGSALIMMCMDKMVMQSMEMISRHDFCDSGNFLYMYCITDSENGMSPIMRKKWFIACEMLPEVDLLTRTINGVKREDYDCTKPALGAHQTTNSNVRKSQPAEKTAVTGSHN
jgi:hypothetical protein